MCTEPCFESSLPMEEIEKNFEGVDFFSGLMAGLEEAIAYERGEAAAETFARKRSLPDVSVSAVRGALGMTQRAFAQVLGVSRRTVEAWESGKTTPSPTAKKLIYLIQEDNALVQKLV